MDGKITYSRRKSFSLRIAPDGSLDIRAPIGMPRREIDRFLEEKADWIATHRAQVLRDRQQGALHAIGAEQLETLKELAREPIYESLRRFAPPDGRELWPGDHPLPEKPLGQLLQRRKSEL